MHELGLPNSPSSVVRFDRYHRAGSVRVYYGVTGRSADSGFPALKGWERETRAGVGFPAIKCEVESDRPGYWNALGWIQWVTQEFRTHRRPFRVVDRFPAFLDRDIPFACAGYAPTFFDAPAYNSLPPVDFRALLFLCTVPIMSRREAIVPLVGFRWGYEVQESGGKPHPYPLEPAAPRDWRSVRMALLPRHRAWRFGAAYLAPGDA